MSTTFVTYSDAGPTSLLTKLIKIDECIIFPFYFIKYFEDPKHKKWTSNLL
jgi:hypothetical protein